MLNEFDLITKLTSPPGVLSSFELGRMAKDFAQLLGWEPSERMDAEPSLRGIASGHLIVEHGLEHAAVITFLISPNSQASLTPHQNKQILSISYNNLIEWNIIVEHDKVSFFFTRRYPAEPIEQQRLAVSNTDALRSTMLDQITGKAPNPNVPALDDALVNNISYWKRYLAAELDKKPGLADYSALFNAIIFVRAIEDHRRRLNDSKQNSLLDRFSQLSEMSSLRLVITDALKEFVNGRLPPSLFDPERLKIFDGLKPEMARDLLSSFYQSRNVPYPYDFAIMSKHALSRIYEHYVSLLSFEESPQLSFIPPLPTEQYSKRFGSVYTPQFIARFFAKYLHNQLTPVAFRDLRVLDPACGSGIFLRTLLEFQLARYLDIPSSQEITQAFENIKGIDIDENAAQASKLSLSLLYLVLMSGDLPQSLDIKSEDALTYYENHPEMANQYDVVIANPPFISTDNQSTELRQKISEFMGDLARGRSDSYAPFLKLAVEALKPGGYGMFVLPHSFLRQNSASGLREFVYENTWIKGVLDLSDIPVFGEKGSYVILLIFQKKFEISATVTPPQATLLICKDRVGVALQSFLSGERIDSTAYGIYDVPQSTFSSPEWQILPQSQAKIANKLDQFQSLGEYLDVLQGVVTGADDIFIRSATEIPEDEKVVWAPLLRDRDMLRYVLPKGSPFMVFSPFIDGVKLSEKELTENFPSTWKYLEANKKSLVSRRSTSSCEWWEPVRSRDPNKLFSPKLITPHLILLPKFSFDQHGLYAVSHSPFIVSKEPTKDVEMLKFFLGILNSTFGGWLISIHSDKYSRGYARLEGKTLKAIPVPNPAKVPYAQLSNFITLVERKLVGVRNLKVDEEIDLATYEFYQLTDSDLRTLGIK